jgi:plastocyanin
MKKAILLAGAIIVMGCGGDGTPQGPGEQPQQGTVQGMVVEEGGGGVSGVTVQLSRAGASSRTASTNAGGNYTITLVDVGTWSLAVTPPAGFEADESLTTSVQVTANATTTVPALQLRRTTQPPGDPAIITMTDDAFTPDDLTISTGRVVRWVNNGSNVHNSTGSGAAWASPNLSQGQTFERTFSQAGVFNYSCTLHAGMTGTITVQ